MSTLGGNVVHQLLYKSRSQGPHITVCLSLCDVSTRDSRMEGRTQNVQSQYNRRILKLCANSNSSVSMFLMSAPVTRREHMHFRRILLLLRQCYFKKQ